MLAVVIPAVVPALPPGLFLPSGGSGTGPGVGGLTVINPVLTLRDNLSPRPVAFERESRRDGSSAPAPLMPLASQP